MMAFADCLLDGALEPVLSAAVRRGRQAAKRKNSAPGAEVASALLAVTVCDPACGPGSLLVAAAGRIARRVAQARGEDQEPDALQRAMRDVVSSCIYGVDCSAEAVRQARDCLQLACTVPGMPPLFLDSRIRPGNALIGASPDLIDGGIPADAFRAAGGDDRRHARSLRRANARPDPGQPTLFSEQSGYSHANETLAQSLDELQGRPAGPAGSDQAAAYAAWRDSAAFCTKRLVADAWCAAFAWAKTPDAPPAIVSRVLLDLREQGADGIGTAIVAEITRLRREHQFFHWDLEFPGVFGVPEGQTRWQGGFSCVLSAPPRGRVDRQQQAALFGFATGSGVYPECTAGLAEPGVSALRADQLFTERIMALLAPGGLAGCALTSGTAAAPGARYLLAALMRRSALASLYDVSAPGSQVCLLTATGAGRGQAPRRRAPASFAFGLADPAELRSAGRSFTLTPDDAARMNPNTGALPAFRSSRDAELVTSVYRQVPVLLDETRAGGDPWRMRLAVAFPRAGADTGLRRSEQELRDDGWEPAGSAFTRDGQWMLPLYEAPMTGLFDHRAAQPRYWIAERGPVAVQRNGEAAQRPGVADRLAELGWTWQWLCAWRAPAGDRTAAAVLLPRAASDGSLPLMLPRVVPPFAAALVAAHSSLVVEYVARQKTGGGALRAADWKQLPVPAPGMLEPHLPFIVPRVLELVCTSPGMCQLARDLDDPGTAPFAWDAERRTALQAELDAFFLHLYGIGERADAQYIIDDVQASAGQGGDGNGRRGRDLILAAYDRMAEASAGAAAYESRIFPPPGHGARSQPG